MRLALAAALACLPAMGHACGSDTDCSIGDRIYRISMPEGAASGVLLYAHGFGGSAAGAMRNGGLRRLAHARGMALIALQGVDGRWDLPGNPSDINSDGQAEMGYASAVLDDAAARFDLPRDNTVMTGFSAGGMMTWNVVCHRSDLLRAAVPMSGTFWEAVPETCDSPPIPVIHIHGDNDGTVPLGGRQIRDAHQGDVPTALAMYVAHGNYIGETEKNLGAMRCTFRENETAQSLGFCLFSGGHAFRLENLAAALDRVN